MKDLFKKVIEVLTSAEANAMFTSAELPPVKFVDIFSGQYLEWENFEEFPLPAILFEWTIDYTNKPKLFIANMNVYNCNIRFICIINCPFMFAMNNLGTQVISEHLANLV